MHARTHARTHAQEATLGAAACSPVLGWVTAGSKALASLSISKYQVQREILLKKKKEISIAKDTQHLPLGSTGAHSGQKLT